jgi:caa(3)-type oxidase subunit IV
MNDLQPADLKQYTKRCFYVFFAVVCGTLTMVAASFAPINSHGLKIALILGIAAVNATLVATFLMHIVSERRFVGIVLSLTIFLFVALLGLSAIAHFDLPRLMAH